ncbi:hypothetical protein [Lentibacillus salinarum]|uniref:Uncharacterized protein n=1 Tax=Lentibacillus salinarum TaxID=446820 RepID=A0ABW3ZRH1_9BACI
MVERKLGEPGVTGKNADASFPDVRGSDVGLEEIDELADFGIEKIVQIYAYPSKKAVPICGLEQPSFF